MKKLFGAVFIAAFLLLFQACEPTAPKDNKTSDTTQVQRDSASFIELMHMVPAPVELTTMIRESNAAFQPNLTNPVAIADKYATSARQAMNLGVYGADMGYLVVFDKSQESGNYFKTARALSEKLDILNVFDEKTINRMGANIQNKDSVLNILSDTYARSDEYLRNNKRPDVAALILAGGWIEGTYLACTINQSKQNKILEERIAQDKVVISLLTEMLGTYSSNADVKELYDMLKDLETAYNNITVDISFKPSNTQADQNLTTFGSTSKVTYAAGDITEITNKIITIRKHITE